MGIRARSQIRVTQAPLANPTPPPEKKTDLLAAASRAATTLFRRPSCPDVIFCNQEEIPVEYIPRSKSAVSVAEITHKKNNHKPISRVQMGLSQFICPYYSAAAVPCPNIQPCQWPCPGPCPKSPKRDNRADCLERLATCGACGPCGPCCCPGCCPGCCLPPPCNQPPKCIQYMLGYYYYPYGFWFCGPYHVQGTCCCGGPVKPGPCGPCGPCVCPCCCALMSTASCFPWPEASPPVNFMDPCGFTCGPCAACGQCAPCSTCAYDPYCGNCMYRPFVGPCYHMTCPPTPCSGPLTCGPCGPICQCYLCSQLASNKSCKKFTDEDVCFCYACRKSRQPPPNIDEMASCAFNLNPKAKFSSANGKSSTDPNDVHRLCKRMAMPTEMGLARYFSTTSHQNTRNYEFGRTDVIIQDSRPCKFHSSHDLRGPSSTSDGGALGVCPIPYEDSALIEITKEERNQHTSSFGYINSPKFRKITPPYVYVPPRDTKQKDNVAMSL